MASAYRGILDGRSQRSKGRVAGPGEDTGELSSSCPCKVLLPFVLLIPGEGRTHATRLLWSSEPTPLPEMGGGGVAEEMAGGQLRALLCTPYMVPHWVAGMVWGHRETRWQYGLPEGQGRWERVRATAEGEHDQEEHPEQHASLRRLLQDDRRRRSSVATAMGMPFAGGAQPWARLCASLSPCPLEAVRQEKEPRLRTELGSSAAFTSIEL